MAGFTLVELLVVIGILAILIGGSVAMMPDNSASARQASREILRAHLQQARAHAIATGIPTAVLFPVATADAEHGQRMISLAEIEPDPSGGHQVTKLLQRWETLPGNIRFLSQRQAGSPRPTLLDESTTLRAPHRKAGVPAHYLLFAGNGQIVHPPAREDGSRLGIALGRAALNQGSITATEKDSQGRVSADFLQINRLTGRTRLLNPASTR